MPNIQSAKKRLRQNLVQRSRNRAVRSELKTYLRRVLEAVRASDVAKSEAEFKAAAAKLDRAANRGLIHPNLAARTKSRLQRRIKAIKKAPAAS